MPAAGARVPNCSIAMPVEVVDVGSIEEVGWEIQEMDMWEHHMVFRTVTEEQSPEGSDTETGMSAKGPVKGYAGQRLATVCWDAVMASSL